MVSQSMRLKAGEPVLKGLILPCKSAFIPLSFPQEAPSLPGFRAQVVQSSTTGSKVCEGGRLAMPALREAAAPSRWK